MDSFELSVGYRSVAPDLLPLEWQAVRHLPKKDLLQLARDAFDARLAETLRSAGAWHWKLDCRELACEVAEMLSFGAQSRYEHLRPALLHYYAERYRRPGVREYRMYLREKKKAAVLAHYEASQQEQLSALLVYASVRLWAEGIRATDTVGVARSMHYNPFATYLDMTDPYRVHHVTSDVVVAVVPGGHGEYRCSTPLWVRIVLHQLDKREGDERISGSAFVAHLVKAEIWIVQAQKKISRRLRNQGMRANKTDKKGGANEHGTL